MRIYIDVRKIQILEDFFKDMARGDKRPIFLKGFRRAAKPILEEARSMVPRRTGKLARSLRSDAVQGEIALEVGAMRRRGGYHGHLVESGTVERFYITRKNKVKKSTGKMPASHFFENAYNNSEERVIDSIVEEIFIEVARRIDKANAAMK